MVPKLPAITGGFFLLFVANRSNLSHLHQSTTNLIPEVSLIYSNLQNSLYLYATEKHFCTIFVLYPGDSMRIFFAEHRGFQVFHF